MTITDVRALTIRELLNRPLRIPPYQRPYSWTAGTAVQLVDDVLGAMHESRAVDGDPAEECSSIDPPSDGRCPAEVTPYVLGTVILHAGGKTFDLVDGQQRTLTLHMLLELLDKVPEDDAVHDFDTSDPSPIGNARAALREQLTGTDDTASLRHFLLHHCQIVQVVTDDLDEAFRIFDSQNHRGKSLLPHDLLKAHHLREMRQDSDAIRAAVIERWEGIDAVELDRLFSVYLHRIHRWSRGLAALDFDVDDIEVFKGIPHSPHPTPWQIYHRSAQTALPLLSIAPTALDVRTLNHAQFQLDAPVQAGRDFFDMTTFMHEELTRLHKEAFVETRTERQQFDGFLQTNPLSRARRVRPVFRYATEPFLAAMLYATNKFGPERAHRIEPVLFRWAFAPRVNQQKLQAITVDNRSKHDGSPFRVLHEAFSLHDTRGIVRDDLEELGPEAAGYRSDLHSYLIGGHA